MCVLQYFNDVSRYKRHGDPWTFPHHNCLDAWLRGDKAVTVPGRGAAAVRESCDAAIVDAGEGETATAIQVRGREGGREGGGHESAWTRRELIELKGIIRFGAKKVNIKL